MDRPISDATKRMAKILGAEFVRKGETDELLALGKGITEGLEQQLLAFEGSDALGNGDFTVCVKAATAIAELRAEVARKDELLARALPVAQAYARANPIWFRGEAGVEQDPNGAHKLLAALKPTSNKRNDRG